MVSVRPTIKVLKTLNANRKLPGKTKAAYESAVRATSPEAKLEYLREAVAHAQTEVALVTYIQQRFDRGIFERYQSLSDPVFESRDMVKPAWRGAVLHDGGAYAWLVYAAIHDHFHSEVQQAVKSMKQSGTFGPSESDRAVLDLQEQLDEASDFARCALVSTLQALKTAVACESDTQAEFQGLTVGVSVESIPYEQWDVDSAHHEMDMVTLKIPWWQQEYEKFNDYVRSFVSVLNAEEELIEALPAKEFTLQVAVSRAALISVLDIADRGEAPKAVAPGAPRFLHYSRKEDLTRSYITGKAVQAVCGKWWIPIGDETTHGGLPVCPECEQEMPVAQALRDFVNSGSVTDR